MTILTDLPTTTTAAKLLMSILLEIAHSYENTSMNYCHRDRLDFHDYTFVTATTAKFYHRKHKDLL